MFTLKNKNFCLLNLIVDFALLEKASESSFFISSLLALGIRFPFFTILQSLGFWLARILILRILCRLTLFLFVKNLSLQGIRFLAFKNFDFSFYHLALIEKVLIYFSFKNRQSFSWFWLCFHCKLQWICGGILQVLLSASLQRCGRHFFVFISTLNNFSIFFYLSVLRSGLERLISRLWTINLLWFWSLHNCRLGPSTGN